MADAPMERLMERLWPAGDDERAFAGLDGARDPAVHAMVARSGLEHRCLYAGALSPALAAAAPWLVKLPRDAAATREILHKGWGEAWGVFLRTGADEALLYRHLRGFLRVRDERGRPLVFRYYDPRVLRVYLPTCTAEELAYVFGPVEVFIVEGEAAGHIQEFRVKGGALVEGGVRVERRLHWLGDYLRKG